MAKVKVGVVGVGVMGEHHARIYSTLKEAKLIGVLDFDQARSNEVAAKYNCRSFSSLDELLPLVEALTIASPTSTHYQVGLSCLKAGKHILIEKPLASSLNNARSLVNESKSNKCLLASGMIERFNPAFLRVYQIVKHEKLLGLDFKRFSPFPARITDASVVFDMMFHDIDLALALARIRVNSISASGKNIRTDKLDEAKATIYFIDGLIAHIEASRVKDAKQRSIHITTDKNIYEVDLLSKRLYKRNFETLTEREEIEVKPADQLTLELTDFCRAVDQGRDPKVSGFQSIPVIEIAEEVEKLSC